MNIRNVGAKLHLLPAVICITLCVAGLLKYPHEAAQGLKHGLVLLFENIVPALFPFMVLSSYISESPATEYTARLLNRFSKKIFGISGYGAVSFLLGCIGGYPIGAKAIADFKSLGKIPPAEAYHLMFWCVNPGPAFVITSVGTFMLDNTKSGIIIYTSCLLSSLCIGAFLRLRKGKTEGNAFCVSNHKNPKYIFIRSVSVSVDSMLGICGWVLVFSTLCALLDCTLPHGNFNLFLKTICEVTLGCKNGIENGLSLPVICAILSFGGLSVTAQISPYLEICKVNPKVFICWRIAGSATAAFICSQILRFFPECATVAVTLNGAPGKLSGSISTAIMMILMCVVLIFEVDNKRKVC